jgi:hypothetical protein
MSRAPRSRRAFLGTAISDDKPPEVGSLCRNSRSVGRTHLCSYKSVCRCLRLDLTCGVAEVCSSAMVKERGQGSRLGRNIVSSTDNAGAAIYRQGAAYSWIGLLNGLFRTPRKATAITTIQWGNPSYDIGTKYTPRDPVEAMRWYKAAVDGDPIKATGPHYSKLRCRDV